MHAASSPMEPLNKNILLAGEVIAEKWKIGEKIGEGTFSQIYSAYSIESRDKVAVKVEAPSSLKPVLEWESLILKSLQDCPYVCRYYYHGKHGDSTVLVMELLGDSMSMLRMSPDSIHGVPLAKSVSVGLEMLDCIEAFHRHGYVHRDIKASNFALSAIPERNPMKRQRYYIIDFGLSRQHLGEDRKVLPARQVAEFRGTSMYASLSSHRRQELGPKDDLWSWFYLVMDFMRGELPWAADAQLKNRQTVLRLKEHFTETNPSLLVEGLPGATELLEMLDYLQSLKYEDLPDYGKIRKQLQAVGESSLVSENSDSGDDETSADKKEALAVAAVSAIDWSAIESERERALQWAAKADEHKNSDGASDMLLTIAKRYNTFFDIEGLSFDERIKVQSAVYRIEKKSRVRSSFLAPPPIQSFVKRRQSEQKMRSDALRKRRERDFQVRQSLELKNEQQLALAAAAQGVTEAAHGSSNGNGTLDAQNVAQGVALRPVKTESSMEVSDNEDTGANRSEQSAVGAAAVADSQVHDSSASMLQQQIPPVSAPISTGPPPQRWDRTSSHGVPVPPPPPPPPGLPLSVQRSGAYAHPPPPPPPPPAGRYPPNGGIPPPPPGFPPTGRQHGAMTLPPPPPPVRSANYQPRYASGSDRHFDATGKSEEDPIHNYQRSHRSPRDTVGSEAREDRGYAFQRPQKSPRDSASGSHYDDSRETRDSRGYYQRAQKSPRESVSGRFLDDPVEKREDRGYGYQHSQKPLREGLSVPDGLYDAPGESREDRGYGYQRPQKLPQEQFPAEQVHVRKEKERHYEGKRARSRSRSSRRGGSRSHRHSYSRSSSRSRSRSYSASPPPHRRSHRRGSRDYSGRHHESKRVETRKEYSRRQRSRSQSSSRSRSSSRSSVSPSPPAKRYRRRSSDLSHSKTSHRHSSHSTSRRRSHSKDYPKGFTKDNPSNYSKNYPTDYQEKYANEFPSKEYAKSYPPKGYVKDYPPKEYVKNYPPKEYVKDYPSKEYVKEYPKEYVKGYPKQYEKEYPKAYLSKDYRTNYPNEHPKDYNRRSRSPDRRHSHSREPEYRRSPSPDHHRSRSRDYGRDDEPWGAETRFKGNPTPEKLRRPSRWQTRP